MTAAVDNGEDVRQRRWPEGIQSANGKEITLDGSGGGGGCSSMQ
jgi:hypothetical protein